MSKIFLTAKTPGLTTQRAGRRYIAEASTLGLKPGAYPVAIETDLGNGQPFMLAACDRNREGEIVAYIYDQQNGEADLWLLDD